MKYLLASVFWACTLVDGGKWTWWRESKMSNSWLNVFLVEWFPGWMISELNNFGIEYFPGRIFSELNNFWSPIYTLYRVTQNKNPCWMEIKMLIPGWIISGLNIFLVEYFPGWTYSSHQYIHYTGWPRIRTGAGRRARCRFPGGMISKLNNFRVK